MYFVIIFNNLIIATIHLLLYFIYLYHNFQLNGKRQILFTSTISLLSVIFISHMSMYSNILFGIINGILTSMFIGILCAIINHKASYVIVAIAEGFNFGLCTSVCVNILNNIILFNIHPIFEIIVCLIVMIIVNIILIFVYMCRSAINY
jgi:hypothetical protein